MAVINKLEKAHAALTIPGTAIEIDDEDVDAFTLLVSRAAAALDDVLPGPPFAPLVDDVLGFFRGCPVKRKAPPAPVVAKPKASAHPSKAVVAAEAAMSEAAAKLSEAAKPKH